MMSTVPLQVSSLVFNRQSVQDAIKSILAKLKQFKQPPDNGLTIFCGLYMNPEGKQKKINIAIEPLKPITLNNYLCDNKFHTEFLKEQLEDTKKFGFIVMDGGGCSIHTLCGSQRETLIKWEESLPKKHGRGGQSHDRFRRIREEKRDWYVKKVAATAVKYFIDDSNNKVNVEGIILSGFGDLKRELSKSQFLDPRVQKKDIKSFRYSI